MKYSYAKSLWQLLLHFTGLNSMKISRVIIVMQKLSSVFMSHNYDLSQISSEPFHNTNRQRSSGKTNASR